MHTRTLRLIRRRRIRNTEDSTDTPYDFVRKYPRKRDRAFYIGFALAAFGIVLGYVRTVR